MNTDFLKLFEETVMADPESLTGGESLESLENWDSLAVVALIALADEHYSVNLTRDDIMRCRTVNDVAALVGSHVAA